MGQKTKFILVIYRNGVLLIAHDIDQSICQIFARDNCDVLACGLAIESSHIEPKGSSLAHGHPDSSLAGTGGI
jgi:hypothetical protein